MNLASLITQPTLMDKETLYQLRSMVALYPYHQTARLLMLQNLYLLHDSSFDEELRRAAIYITDRRAIFNMVEAPHYTRRQNIVAAVAAEAPDEDRTLSLIDTFIDSLPTDEDQPVAPSRKPTPADATIDYIAYLAESEAEQLGNDTPVLNHQDLIDDFLNNNTHGRIMLNENPEFVPDIPEPTVTPVENTEEGLLTETLAQIYIKQGRYSRALEIIRQLNLNYPKKNVYFADQIRFLEKIIEIKKRNESKKQ